MPAWRVEQLDPYRARGAAAAGCDQPITVPARPSAHRTAGGAMLISLVVKMQ